MNSANHGFFIGHSRDHHDTSQLIGQMVLAFSGIEIEVGTCLQYVAGTELFPVVDKLVFKHKIDAVLQLMALRPTTDPCRLAELQLLLQRVNRLRHRRNAFVHGRWDEQRGQFHLLQPARGLTGRREEIPCSLALMHEELRHAHVLLFALRKWRQHRLSGSSEVSNANTGKKDCAVLKKINIRQVVNVPWRPVSLDEASAFGLVTLAFDGDDDKAAIWFRAKNPLLGDISPLDMIRLGRLDRLRKFILGAMGEKAICRLPARCDCLVRSASEPVDIAHAESAG